MKKLIISAAFVLILGGYAAAQKTSSQPVKKQATVQKGKPSKTPQKNVLKQESSSNAKSDSTKLFNFPQTPVDSNLIPRKDTLVYPMTKHDEE
jgi:hypothetical protein